jgi:transcriptional regulator with XRE-family HTH domain
MSDIFRDYSFGGWIRDARLKKGLTLREFARRLDDSAGNVSRMENNETAPPRKAEKIDKICEALEDKELAPLLKSLALQHHIAKLQEEFGI